MRDLDMRRLDIFQLDQLIVHILDPWDRNELVLSRELCPLKDPDLKKYFKTHIENSLHSRAIVSAKFKEPEPGKTLLFSVELGLQSDLEDGCLSSDFQQEFQSHGIPLLANITITRQEESHLWRIKDVDTGRTYFVERTDKALNVYGAMAALCLDILDGRIDLIAGSQQLARSLYDVIARDKRTSPCDLAVCLFHAGDRSLPLYLALLKLDPSTAWRHVIHRDHHGTPVSVTLELLSDVLPAKQQRLQKCAFIPSREFGFKFDLMVLDEQVRKQRSVAKFFSETFLNCELVLDRRWRTHLLYTKALDACNALRPKLEPEKVNEFRQSIDEVITAPEIDIDQWLDSLGELGLKKEHLNKIDKTIRKEISDREFKLDTDYAQGLVKQRRFQGDFGLQIDVRTEKYDELVQKVQWRQVSDNPGHHYEIEIHTNEWQEVVRYVKDGGGVVSPEGTEQGPMRQLEYEPERPYEERAELRPPPPHRVERYTYVDFPQQVRLEPRPVPLTVSLTQAPVDWSRVTRRMEVELAIGEPEELQVILRAQDFEEVYGHTELSLTVYPDRDSVPVTFYLRPLSLGDKRIVLDFYHRNRNVGSVSFVTQVVEAETVVAASPVSVEPAEVRTSPPDAQPPDLELRITLSEDQHMLQFTLHSTYGEVGYHHTRVGSVWLRSPPQPKLGSLFEKLSSLARRREKEKSKLKQEEIRKHLENIGRTLYRDLFPPELKQAYRQFRDSPRVQSILITSDEPWIPWELVKPYDNTDLENIIDDEFLCERFRVSRWLAGPPLPDGAWVALATLVVPESGLKSVKTEEDYFQKLKQRLPIEVQHPSLQRASEVDSLLEQGKVNLWHFACHGNFNSQRPNDSAVELTDGPFRPSNIVGPQATGVKLAKPLVFLNACHTSQLGFALTGLGGWAQRFVREGACGFVGSAWEVHDELAAEFAVRFYNELWKGASLAEAFHSARLHIKDQDETNPTWLAYTLYGDPKGKARVAGRAKA